MGTCEGSATQALDATRCGSFDFARRLASLRMTLHSVMGFEPFEIHYEATDSARAWSPIHVARMRASYGPKSGPKAGSRASSPGEQAAACDYRKISCAGLRAGLTFDCARGETADVVLDEERVHDRDGYRAEQRAGHQCAPEVHVATDELVHHADGNG